MNQISLFTNRESEVLFFTMLAKNVEVPLKELCRKIPRKMLYKYLSQLYQIQTASGMSIIGRNASFCKMTGLPNIIIERKSEIKIEQIADGTALIRLGSL
jgi:hypothetical protein